MLHISIKYAIFAVELKIKKRTFFMCKNSKNLDTNNLLSELFSLSPVKNKPLEVSFTAPDLSSQGGLLLLNEYEVHHGFIAKLADCVEDTRSPLLVQHPFY